VQRTADTAKFKPANRETADHSLPVTVAMSLLDGKLTAAQFESDRWAEADIAALVSRIEVQADIALLENFAQGRPVRMTIDLDDGQTLTEFQSVPYGDATRPMDDHAVEQKFLANVTEVFGLRRALALIDCVRNLQDISNINQLTSLLRAG
jgi:2-methylcitrate dehydratase